MKSFVALATLFLLPTLGGCGQKGDDATQPSSPQPRTSQPPIPPQPRATANANDVPSVGKSAAPMPIYVTPLYNSEGPLINVGPFSKQLATANAGTITDVAVAMKKQWDTLPIEAMYVAAIRHYDLGHKDEAVYWFYSAQYRARLFNGLLSDDNERSIGAVAFEAASAHASFNELAGEWINGYAFGDTEKLKTTIDTVRSENEKTIPKFASIYPKVKFIPEASWAEKNKKAAAGLTKLSDYIKDHADEIKAKRKENGVEGKY